MKIGILSMQKIMNYGSFLQALSLKMQFEQRGHEVYFIDIESGRQIVQPDARKPSMMSKLDRHFFKRIGNLLLTRKMNQIHVNDYTRYLLTDKKLEQGEMFDLVVIGSDEVFNATIPSRWGFSKQLFGQVSNARKVVTYAASCGSTTLESVRRYAIDGEIAETMKNLSAISVRDQNSADFVTGLTGRIPQIHVDPVFLADYDSYIPEGSVKKPYMLVYAYVNRISDEREIAAIKAYAKERNLQTVSVGTQQRWCDRNVAANAFELLNWVRNAECIVTDTFHGSVFSMKYNKKFVTLIRDSNRNKLGGLLQQFGLVSRSVDDVTQFAKAMDAPVAYAEVNSLIAQEQLRSTEYLDQICLVE